MRAFHERVAKFDAELTSSQHLLAEYVMAHAEQVMFMSARQLAHKTGQSDAAVIRFAQAIGFSGFTELKESLRDSLLERRGVSGLGQQLNMSSGGDALKKKVFETDAFLVQQTALLNPEEVILNVVDVLIAARRVRITGHSTTYPLAAYAAALLNQFLEDAQIFNIGHGDLAERLRSINEQDVFIGIGYVRYIPYTLEIMRLARDKGAGIIAITDRMSSPLARLADHTLYVARGMSSPVWWSQTGTMSIINMLSASIIVRDAQTVAARLKRSDEEWQHLGHWNSTSKNRNGRSLQQHLDKSMRFGTDDPIPDKDE